MRPWWIAQPGLAILRWMPWQTPPCHWPHRGSKQQLPRFLYFQKFNVLRHAAFTGVDDAEPRDDGAHELCEGLTVYNEIRTKGFD